MPACYARLRDSLGLPPVADPLELELGGDDAAAASRDVTLEFDFFGVDVFERVGVRPMRNERRRDAYLERYAARLEADRARHQHAFYLQMAAEKREEEKIAGVAAGSPTGGGGETKTPPTPPSEAKDAADGDSTAPPEGDDSVTVDPTAPPEASSSWSAPSGFDHSAWDPGASCWRAPSRTGAKNDATLPAPAYHKDWARFVRALVLADASAADNASFATCPLRELWGAIAAEVHARFLADLQASIEERLATEATGIRAAEAFTEAERRVASKRSDPRLEAAREADEPDAKLIEKLEFELAESLAPLEVALDEARAASAEAEIAAKKAAEERARLEKDLAEAIASGPATESVAPADRAMAALASRTGGVAFADDLVANCCELTEASREAIDAFDARRRAEEEALAANKGKPPNPPPPDGEPAPEPETRPEEVRVMTWRAFETMYMSTDFGAPEMCPAEARRLAREASAREAEAEKKGAASDANKKGGNKDKDKIAEEGDADDAGEEDAIPRARPPPRTRSPASPG